MDASIAIAVLLSGVSWAFAGFILGRVQRGFRFRREARDNLARANARANAVRHAVKLSGGDDDSDSDSDSDSHGDSNGVAYSGPVNSSPGRRAIPRPDDRSRPGRYVAGRNPRFADEAALVGAPPRRSEYDC